MRQNKRKEKRFKIEFTLFSNTIKGDGIDISKGGIAFTTNEEIIPADNIPFEIDIKIENDPIYRINGYGDLIYSNKENDCFRNAIRFIKLSNDSNKILKNIITRIKQRS